MPLSVKVTLIKIEIKNELIKTPKVSVMIQFGGQTSKLPNARFAHKNEVSFFRQHLTLVSSQQGSALKISILGVTGSHEKEIGLVKVSNEELLENDGQTQLIRRGNDDFILEFEVLYNSVHQDRIMTQQSEAVSQDSYFEVQINKLSLGRDSVSISQGKGKRPPSNRQTPQRSRPSFQKSGRNSFNIASFALKNTTNPPPLKINTNQRSNQIRLSINQQRPQHEQLFPINIGRSSQPIQVKQQTKPMYTSTKTIKTIKQKQSRIQRATISQNHHSQQQHHDEHHHQNPQFNRKDYIQMLVVSLIFWLLGRFIKQL